MFSGSIDPTRPRRTEATLVAIGIHARGAFRVLEIGSGPGRFAQRLLRRYPRCRIVAVDTDPVLLRIAAEALRRYRRRTRWVLADVRQSRWAATLPVRRFDLVVTSLTLHWLEENEIRRLYARARSLLRPDGVLIEADYLPSDRRPPPGDGAGRSTGNPRSSARRRSDRRAFRVAWGNWWAAVAGESSLRDALDERRRRMPGEFPPRRTTGPKVAVSIEAHERALRAAGFRRTEVVWQEGAFRVVVAAR